jgi:DNA-binding response OmpR family regulator
MAGTDSSLHSFERPPSLMVVEDEVLIRMALTDHLQECGYRVFEASSAAEAIQMLENGEVPIDLIFTDVRMPGDMDGWGLAAWAREHQPGTAVIVTSAERQSAAHELCKVLPFLHKPYDFGDVAARISALVRKTA